MSDEDLARVFVGPILNVNSQIESLNPYGNGIGLAFCKQVCQSVDGDISVESILGMGSRFTFTMGMKKVEDYSHKYEQRDDTDEQQEGDIIFKGSPEGYNASFDELMYSDFAQLLPSQENQVISFQSANFVYKVSRTTPVEMVRGDDLPHFDNLVSFLKTLQANNLLEKASSGSKVVYADDQFVNQHTVMKNFEELKIGQQLISFSNGQDVIDYLQKILDEIKMEDLAYIPLPIQPVALVLLDINMPILDGFETLGKTKAVFKEANIRLTANQLESDTVVMRPTICFFSQF